MPKGKKNCPKCKSELGVRVKKCDCGHEFGITSAVPASGQSMILDPLDKQIAASVGSVRDIIAKAEVRSISSKFGDTEPSRRTRVERSQPQKVQPQAVAVPQRGGRNILVPAGPCPVKPEGYKDKWTNGSASDETVQNWALNVYNSGECRLTVNAVVYFARHFWEGPEFRRVSDLIVNTLQVPQKSA